MIKKIPFCFLLMFGGPAMMLKGQSEDRSSRTVYNWNELTGQYEPQNEYQWRYNEQGKQIQFDGFLWADSLNSWYQFNQARTDYYSNGKISDEYSWTQYPEDSSAFEEEVSYLYEESYGLLSEKVTRLRTKESVGWRNHRLESWTYDENGCLVLHQTENGEELDQWQLTTQTEYFDLDAQCNPGIAFNQRFVDGQWENNYRVEYSYENNGLETDLYQQNWNSQTQQWEYSGSYRVVRDEHGNDLLRLRLNPDSSQYRVEQQFDANNQLIAISESSKGKGGDWWYFYRYQLFMDGNGLTTSSLFENQFDTLSGLFRFQQERIFSYDEDDRLILEEVVQTDLLHPSNNKTFSFETAYQDYCDGRPKIITIFEHEGGWSRPRSRTHLGYREGVDCPSEAPGFVLYPNPAVNAVVILSPLMNQGQCQVRILDLSGRLVHFQTIPFGAEHYVLSLLGLQKGAYIVQLIHGDQMLSQKLLKN